MNLSKFKIMAVLLIIQTAVATERIVLIEAFLNEGCGACAKAKPALEQLWEENPDDLIVLEYYHSGLNVSGVYERHSLYVPGSKSVPDVYFDGLNHQVSGAASTESAYNNYKDAFDQEIERESPLSISIRITDIENSIRINATLNATNLTDERNLTVNFIAYEDNVYYQEEYERFVVRKILPDAEISIGNNETKSVTAEYSLEGVNESNTFIAVFAQDMDDEKLDVLQATSAPILQRTFDIPLSEGWNLISLPLEA